MNKIFFEKDGLTVTSAQHIKDMAGHFIESTKEKLNSISFINKTAELIGNSESQAPVTLGTTLDELNNVNNLLLEVAQAQALQAWLGEAIKAYNNQKDWIKATTVVQFLDEKYRKLVSPPIKISLDEYLKTQLSRDELEEYYRLQTYCSVYGNAIHKSNKTESNFYKARIEAQKAKNNPAIIKGDGRDTIIIRQSLSIELSDIDEVYYDLQAKHRGYQARLNRILHEFESFAEEKYAEDLKNYEKYQTESNEAYKQAEIAKEHFIDMANRELNSCKITIPNSLQSIYSKINSLGK